MHSSSATRHTGYRLQRTHRWHATAVVILTSMVGFVTITASTEAVAQTSAEMTAALHGELRTELRAHLKNPEFSLDRKPEYVVTDPAIVEPAIDQALKYLDLTRALSATDREDVRRRAVSAYKNGLATPTGLRTLEGLIADRFAHPRTTREAGSDGKGISVTLDFGRMPGTLRADFFGPYLAADGPDFERGLPTSVFLANMIANAALDDPAAATLVLNIGLPLHRRNGSLTLSYVRDTPTRGYGSIGVRAQRVAGLVGPYGTRVIDDDFGPYTSGRFSLYEDCTELAYRPQSSAMAERLRALAKKCSGYGEAGRPQ